MTALEKHREAWPDKTDEWLFERLDNELKDKVETIHRLIQEKEMLDLSELMEEFGTWLSKSYQITINCKYWDGNNGYFTSKELVNKFLTEKGYIQL